MNVKVQAKIEKKLVAMSRKVFLHEIIDSYLSRIVKDEEKGILQAIRRPLLSQV